jgi:DNA-binding response OmpR family regulator
MAYAEDAGANSFLRKPFSMRQLTDCVESLLNATRWSVQPMRGLQLLAGKAMSARNVANRNAESPGLSAAG